MRLTVKEIYKKLVDDDKILTKQGLITFSLGDTDIIVKQRDVVGNIMQEWVEGWMKQNKIEYALNENTQMPPDFYLNPDNKKESLMEIKVISTVAQGDMNSESMVQMGKLSLTELSRLSWLMAVKQ